ncbi:hypothetical protein L7F22_020830 [Adiantum nelumboides]|nr:hypothetical protein [Adiantum nelumboides]
MSASYMKDPAFKQCIQTRSTSPVEVVLGFEEDVRQGTYCQLLCALLHWQEVVKLGVVYASALLHVMHVLKSKWRKLVNDIRIGSLNQTEVFDPSVRKAVERQMERPNPALAMQVSENCDLLGLMYTASDIVLVYVEEACCCQSLRQGIVRRIWHSAKCVIIVSGSMEQYVPNG